MQWSRGKVIVKVPTGARIVVELTPRHQIFAHFRNQMLLRGLAALRFASRAMVLLGCIVFVPGLSPSVGAQVSVSQGMLKDSGYPEPPRVTEARRFMAQRLWRARRPAQLRDRSQAAAARSQPASTGNTASWQPLGPTAVSSMNFGLLTGRISSIAFDTSDLSGNKLYVGTTGGGLWYSQDANASNPANVVFTPLTDRPAKCFD